MTQNSDEIDGQVARDLRQCSKIEKSKWLGLHSGEMMENDDYHGSKVGWRWCGIAAVLVWAALIAWWTA